MHNTPTPEPAKALAGRVEDNRDALTRLMADTGRCDDITSGLLAGVADIPVDAGIDLLSDRRVKRDIVAVEWSR